MFDGCAEALLRTTGQGGGQRAVERIACAGAVDGVHAFGRDTVAVGLAPSVPAVRAVRDEAAMLAQGDDDGSDAELARIRMQGVIASQAPP